MKRCLPFIALAVGMSACSRANPWEEVNEVCQWESFVEEHGFFDRGLHEYQPVNDHLASVDAFPSIDCLETLAHDLGIDLEAFETEDAHLLPNGRYDVLDGIDSVDEYESMTARLLFAARSPFVVDMGSVDDLTAGELIDPEFVTDMQRAQRKYGTDEVHEALYAFVRRRARVIRLPTAKEARRREDRDVPLSYGAVGKILIMSDLESFPPGIPMFSGILHEARHRDGPVHTFVQFPDGIRKVDSGRAGSMGYEIAMKVSILRAYQPEVGTAAYTYLTSSTRTDMEHVLPLLTSEGDFKPEWGVTEPDGTDQPFDYWR